MFNRKEVPCFFNIYYLTAKNAEFFAKLAKVLSLCALCVSSSAFFAVKEKNLCVSSFTSFAVKKENHCTTNRNTLLLPSPVTP